MTGSMQIVLLRHGETNWNLQGRCQGATDLELNETGIQQAREIATYLSKERIDVVYSSNLKRAVQTANAIGQSHDLEVIPDSDFRELNHGILEGMTFPEIRASYPDFIKRWRNEPAELLIPGGERLIDVERRSWRGLERVMQSHLRHETVVVVTHNFPIVTILCRITETPLNNYRSFRVDPCGINRITYNQEVGWRISQINHRGYPPLA